MSQQTKILTEFEQSLFQAAKDNNANLFLEIIKKGINPFILDEKGIAAISYMKPYELSKEDYDKIMKELFK